MLKFSLKFNPSSQGSSNILLVFKLDLSCSFISPVAIYCMDSTPYGFDYATLSPFAMFNKALQENLCITGRYHLWQTQRQGRKHLSWKFTLSFKSTLQKMFSCVHFYFFLNNHLLEFKAITSVVFFLCFTVFSVVSSFPSSSL